jgi:hypothetical protein
VRFIVIAVAIATLAILATSNANAHALKKGKRGSEIYWQHNYYHAHYTLRWWDDVFGRRYFITIREVVLERKEVRKHTKLIKLAKSKLAQIKFQRLTEQVDSCLRDLIRVESGAWPPYTTREAQVTNPYSGAYGLPQALPGYKMASAGPDWATNPYTQIRWMKRYVMKYGGSCSALAFQRAHGYY